MEGLLAVLPVVEGEHNVFVDTNRPMPELTGQGDRVFGGITLGQSLNAAQQTVSPQFVAHSMHCTFVSGRVARVAVEYHVERIKDGRQFCVRGVRAVQGGRTFFVALVNFTTQSLGSLHYSSRFPNDVPMPPSENDDDNSSLNRRIPFLHHSVGLRLPSGDALAQIHQWVRAREPISTHNSPNTHAHLAALACMSDSYLLAGAPHSHGIYDFASPPVSEVYNGRHGLSLPSETHQPIPRPHLNFPGSTSSNGRVKVMASLDHSLYFHDPVQLRADQWLLSEIHSSWAGSGRALVHMKIWGKDGTLVASCTQEGLVSVEDLPQARDSRL
ncbi:acyl-CoA thioesterase II [Sporothrix schenckii ATCC 58251]|uniref:Acyl-CoA thioesterase II n=1 Tax=Sporothrix schenckii (strain ATCC 58251 / de Perez 2211183) TaxID=1391915 RepID=U7PKK7_SPOS1|nr:acyl-CoA thioesterase II [Sporothrix schenckii ATCC 58251]